MESIFCRQSCRMLVILLSMPIIFLPSCAYLYQTQASEPGFIRKDGTLIFVCPDNSVKASIFIEIADTPETRQKGLMWRGALDDNSGMLFVYDDMEPQKIWMKNTPVPLDIIFIGEDGCVINIVESAPPMSDKDYLSAEPVKYVVEVRAGFSKHFRIDSDTCIQWRYKSQYQQIK